MKCFSLAAMLLCMLTIFIPHSLSEPVLLYTFDEASGDSIVDKSGNGNDGTMTGITGGAWNQGKRSGGLYFDGGKSGADYIVIQSSESMSMTDAITIMTWFKPEAMGGNGLGAYRFILKKEAVYALAIVDHNVNLFLATESENWAGTLASQTALQENEWYHIAAAYDGSVIRLYINGELDAESSWDGKIGVTDRVIMIGANVSNNAPMRLTSALEGVIDELAVYNHALNQEAVKHYMNNGILEASAVSSADKVAVTWANIKVK
jgi:hypothetical protein